MTFNPIIAVFAFASAIAVGALLIALYIRFDHLSGTRRQRRNSHPPSDPRPPAGAHCIFASNGLHVYRQGAAGPAQSPIYYLDVDDRIITRVQDASGDEYASVRCVLPQQVARSLGATLCSSSEQAESH